MNFITSDTHWSHKLITEQRGFGTDFEAHDKWLIEKWNSVVGEKDTVIHLGDICFQPATRIQVVLPQLHGKIILVLGNHDKGKQLAPYVHEIYSFLQWNNKYILSHVPIHESQFEERFKDYKNLHGHLHIGIKAVTDKRYFNVNCEFHDFVPQTFLQIEEKIRSRK